MANTEPNYNSVINYDYLLGASLPDSSVLYEDAKTSYDRIVSHDYTTKEKLPELKSEQKGNVQYEDVVDYDYVVNKEESGHLETIRFLEELLEKIHPLNLKLNSQNRQLKEAIVKLQAEKQVLLSSPENKNIRKVLELEKQLKEMKRNLTGQIIKLSDELVVERQKTTTETSGLLNIFSRGKQTEQIKSDNIKLISENIRLKQTIQELKQYIQENSL